MDKARRNAYHRAYREANKVVLHARAVAYNKRRRHKDYAKIQAIKEGAPCLDCGLSFPYFVMDFDHRDPETKRADVSALIKCGYAWSIVLDEISKCDLLCACCHRMRTYKGNNSYRTRRFQHHRAVLDELKKSTPCLDCGGLFEPAAMDFDHIGDKTANIAALVGVSNVALLDELSKCHLVCANCHRVRGASGIRPQAPGHSAGLVRRAQTLMESIPVPQDQRYVSFPLPQLLGTVPDKELAAITGVSRQMVAWHRRKAGIRMTRQGEVLR